MMYFLYKFKSAKAGWMDLSTIWFSRRYVDNSYLDWEENGNNFLHKHNATIGLDSNFYVFTVHNNGGETGTKI